MAVSSGSVHVDFMVPAVLIASLNPSVSPALPTPVSPSNPSLGPTVPDGGDFRVNFIILYSFYKTNTPVLLFIIFDTVRQLPSLPEQDTIVASMQALLLQAINNLQSPLYMGKLTAYLQTV